MRVSDLESVILVNVENGLNVYNVEFNEKRRKSIKGTTIKVMCQSGLASFVQSLNIKSAKFDADLSMEEFFELVNVIYIDAREVVDSKNVSNKKMAA